MYKVMEDVTQKASAHEKKKDEAGSSDVMSHGRTQTSAPAFTRRNKIRQPEVLDR